MRACALDIRGFDEKFEAVRACTFIDTERCCSGLTNEPAPPPPDAPAAPAPRA
jgi:hypothetical protein